MSVTGSSIVLRATAPRSQEDDGSKPSQLTFMMFLEYRGPNKYSLYYCSCGKTKVVRNTLVNTRKVVSCGCFRRSVGGLSTDPIYKIWKEMIRRCADVKNKNYGMRGISVCDKWKNSFEAFRDDMGPRPRGLSVERKNVNGDYTPENCIWADGLIQRRNQRRMIERDDRPCPI